LQAVSVVLYLTAFMSAARTHHAPFVSSKAPRGKTMNVLWESKPEIHVVLGPDLGLVAVLITFPITHKKGLTKTKHLLGSLHVLVV